MDEKRLEAAARNSASEKGLLQVCGSAELRGSLWLRNGKVRSQVSGIDRSRFPGRRTVRKVRRGGRRGRRASDRAKERVYSLSGR